jgi:hypothetical protein
MTAGRTSLLSGVKITPYLVVCQIEKTICGVLRAGAAAVTSGKTAD